jgi:hypothetical protein
MVRNRAGFTLAVLFGLLLLGVTMGQAPQLQPARKSLPGHNETDLAIHHPDLLAWKLFIEINAPANNGTNDVVWETWASDDETFPAQPDPAKPPPWPGPRSRIKTLRPPVKLTRMKLTPGQKAPQIAPNGNTEEVRRNKETFDFIMANHLWYLQGLTAAFAAGNPIDFPTPSIEVKARWKPIAEADKPRFHWNVDKSGKLFGLIALHISSKTLPNWFWATFEHVDNPDRGAVLGCQDSFGVTPPRTCNATVSEHLKKLFAEANFGSRWLNYRLDGTQTEFLDSTGRPNRMGNSIIEDGAVAQSSCVTCHAMARVDASKIGDFQFVVGAPDPALFYNPDGTRKSLQLDFVWGFLFAKPAPAKP